MDRRLLAGTAIALARKRCQPGAFQMQIPLFAPFVPYFSEEDRPPIPQLGDIDPKLMAGVEHGQRVHPRD